MTAPQGGGLRHEGDEDRFVVIPRPTIRDDRLSFRARGLLTFILDLPDGWEIRATWLATQGREGEEAVYTTLRELREFGYYRVERRKGAGGRWVNGTAIRKRPSEQWAAEYAAEVEARKAKRKVEAPVWVPDDQSEVTESDAPVTSADLAVSGNRGPREGEAEDRVPPSLTEHPSRRTEEEDGDSEGVTYESRGASEQPPLDAPDGTHRTCPQHRVTPALGPCTPCGQHRVAWARRVSIVEAREAEERMAAADAERRAKRELRQLAEAEVGSCGYCDDDGTAFHDVDGEPGTTVCQHDADANIGAIRTRRRMRAEAAALTRRPAAYGRKG